MSEFKGTPGPWSVSDKLYIEELDEEMLPVSGKGKEVAYTLFRRGEYKTTGEANARLIAAAPDLLKALQLEVSAYPSGSSIDPNKTKWLEVARAAIKKALGND